MHPAILDPDGPEGGLAGLWLELVGQLHPVVVHFPVALLIVAAVLELGALIAGLFGREASTRPGRSALVCLAFAALGGAAAAFSGWTLSERMVISDRIAETVEWHRWAGVAAAALALLALLPALLARGGEARGALRLYRALVLIGAGAVGYAGHLGGVLVHGADALGAPLEALLAAYRDPPAEEASGTTRAADPAAVPAESTAAVESRVEPRAPAVPAVDPAGAHAVEGLALQARALLGARCVECHGPVRAENGTRFDSRRAILEDYLAFEGDPDASLMVERVELPLDDEEHMPSEGAPLSADERRLLREWIAAGLPWPADGEPAREP